MRFAICMAGTLWAVVPFAQTNVSLPTAREVIAQSGTVGQAEPEVSVDEPVGSGAAEEVEATPTLEMESSLSDAFVIDLDRIKLDKFYDALELQQGGDRVMISLEECVQIALMQNQDIEIAALDPLRADGQLMSARGEFDPILSGSATYSEAKQSANAQTVAFGGVSAIESFNTDLSATLSGKLHWGTQYQLSLSLTDEETTFNNFIEEWGGGASLTITQPLLRGFGKKANLARVRQAKNARLQSEETVRLTVMRTIGDVVRSYWDLVGAIQNVRVRRTSVENAERLLDITQRRMDIGTAAPIDVVQAQAGVAVRQSDLISAMAQSDDAGDLLKRLLNLQEDSQLSRDTLVPTDRPNPANIETDFEASVAQAMNNRPEIRTAELNIENADIERKRSRNDMLPQVDVTATYSRGGRGHKIHNVTEGFGDSTDNLVSVGVSGSLPIRNRAARGAYHSAEMSLRESELQYEKTIQDLVLEVSRAFRAVQTNRILVESNRQSRIVQESNLAAEEKRLQLGLTTNFRVLEIEEDLTTAEVQELQAQIALEKAVIDLAVAEGALLDDLGIVFEAPESERTTTYLQSVWPLWNGR